MHNTLKIIVLVIAGIVSIYISDKVFRISETIGSVDREKKQLQQTHLPRFEPNAMNLPASIEFKAGGKYLVVNDPANIKEFLRLIGEGAEVRAHHSHPEREILLTIAGWPDVYKLGRDSSTPNEFWLTLAAPQGKKVYEPTIYHFWSPALSEWVKRLENRMAAVMVPLAF